MEINMTQLCDLDFMLDDALACVISILEWSHPTKPNEMWRLDAVLQDQMGNRVQATVRNQDIKIVHPIINPRGFRFEHFGAFTSRKISESHFVNVIGTIVSISNAIPFNYVGVDKIRRTVILEDFALTNDIIETRLAWRARREPGLCMESCGERIVDSIWEHDNDLEEDQEDDGDYRDTFDITGYLNHTLEKLLEDKILNVAMVDEEADPTRDLEDPERLLDKIPVSMTRNVKMEPDIENMTMNKYLEYEAAKERQLWDDVRSRRSPTNYNKADVDSFHRNKSKTFSYPYSHNLTPPHPCFLLVQPYLKNYLVSTNEGNDVDIESMTIAEYNLYVAKQGLGMNPLNNHSYGVENMKRMGQDIVQDSIWEHYDDSKEDQEEDGDDGDTFNMWDITVEDVERIRKFLTSLMK
ncbi:hypothetical protein Tco_0455971 [Tanacetum coccineum]